MSELKMDIKNEKKEVVNMKKIAMGEVTEDVVLDILKAESSGIEIPKEVVLLDFKVDEYKANDGEMKPWAHLYVAGKEEYDTLKSVGREGNAFTLTVKLASYDGSSLEHLKGKTLDLSEADLIFNISRFKKIEGLSYRSELKNIKVVG